MSDMDDELMYYNALSVLVRRAREQVRRNPHDKQVAELGFSPVKTKDPRAALEKSFDGLEKALAEAFLLRLVAAFEAEAFARLGTAVGEARRSVEARFAKTAPFSRAAVKLVRGTEDFHNLAAIENLLRSYPRAPVDELEQLREHRNLIAHGGRLGRLSTFTSPVDVHRALSQLLGAIMSDESKDEEDSG